MIEIAKALSKNADLIVMDEPSAILAGTELEQLFNIIQSLVKRGVSVIYISHRLEEVFKIADVVSVLKDGQLVDTKPIKELDRSQLVRMMVGRSLEEVFPVSTHQPEDIIFEAKNKSVKTLICIIPEESDAGAIILQALLISEYFALIEKFIANIPFLIRKGI